jgi:hypothetical protein
MFIRQLVVLGALAALAMAHPALAKNSKSKSAKHMSESSKSKSLTMAHPSSSTAKKSKSKSKKPTSKAEESKSKTEKSKSKDGKSKSKAEKSKSKKHKSKVEKSKSKAEQSKSKDAKSKSKAGKSKSKSKKPEQKVEWCHVQKLKLSPSDAASYALKHPQDYPATDGVCIPPLNIGTLYDEGCPCFHEEDLDAFLSFAAGADYCTYSEFIYVVYASLSLYASDFSDDNVTTSQSFNVYDEFSGGGTCYSEVAATDYDTGPIDIDGFGQGTQSNYAFLIGPYAETAPECQALIEAVKRQMKALGCEISSFPCPYTCINGDCTDDGCICYTGWTGDSCDEYECDTNPCVNGNCTADGCVCDDRWTGDTCTECEYGWTGVNCDECDPNVCVNGVCTDSGCACNDNWTGEYCDTCDEGWGGVNCNECEFGWVGDNCDACDPNFCANGHCSSCVRGECTASGCTCNTDWYGDKCDRVYDEGCPCFNEEDVDTFLSFAAIAGADPEGYCEYLVTSEFSWTLLAYISTVTYKLDVSATTCSSFRTYDREVPIDAVESAECRGLIENAGAKDNMVDAGCEFILD